MAPMSRIPVLEIGGSHVTAALVDLAGLAVHQDKRWHIEPHDDAQTLLDTFARAGQSLGTTAGTWGVAIPGPFDYDTGIGRYANVGKFDSLNGVDVRAALTPALAAASIRFLNDADAFAIGEAVAGAARGFGRAVILTLGSGIGSAFLDDGEPVKSGDEVPPGGYVHYLQYRGADIEESMSRRALRRAYHERTGTDLDVIDIANLVRSGDKVASQVWQGGMTALTETIGPWVARFGAEVVIVGGAIAKSWDLIEPALKHGFTAAGAEVEVRAPENPDDAALFGAARWATHP